jgi:hypothetical protein
MWTICFGIYLALALPLASWFILALKGAKRVDHARFGDEEFKPSYARFPLKTTAEITSPVSSAEHL